MFIDNFCQNIKSFQKHQDLKALESLHTLHGKYKRRVAICILSVDVRPRQSHQFSSLDSQYIYQNSKLLGPVFYFTRPGKNSLWAVWAEQHAPIHFCPRPARKKTNIPLKSVHFKITVVRSSFLSKLWSLSIQRQLTLF